MEDYYERYIDKEKIINEACTCIEANRSSKLQSEISQIKDTISKLTISESWQDVVGDSFGDVINSCVSVLEQIENSICSQFATSEKIYMLIKTQLSRLKMINELYRKHYLKKIYEPSGINATEEKMKDYNDSLHSWKLKLKNYKKRCIDLSTEIDNNFKLLNDINGMTVKNKNNINLPSLKISIDDFKQALGIIGMFVFSDTPGIYGTVVSGLDGREFTIYNQGELDQTMSGWRGYCNRASAASIASGYATDGLDPIEEANKVSKYNPNIGYNQEATSDYFKRFGCRAHVNKVICQYDDVKEDIVSSLRSGKKVMFDLDESNTRKTGASEQTWLSKRHWVAALDIKTVDGKDYIFISDSGHDGSTKDYYGLGEGWYSVDEFKGMHVANVTTVSPPANTNLSTGNSFAARTANYGTPEKTIEIPDNVTQAGYTVTCYESDGWHFNASSQAKGVGVGSGQKLIHDAWNSQGSNYTDGGIAVIDDNGTPRYLVATTDKMGNVGDRLRVNFENGQSIDVLIADQKNKNDKNFTEYGHKSPGGAINILEFEVNTQDFRDKSNPTTETWGLSWDSNSPIISIENYGSAKEDLSAQYNV